MMNDVIVNSTLERFTLWISTFLSTKTCRRRHHWT
jgi:hypothetical protein